MFFHIYCLRNPLNDYKRENVDVDLLIFKHFYFCRCDGHFWLSPDVAGSDFESFKSNFCTYDGLSVEITGSNSEIKVADLSILGPQALLVSWYRRLSNRVKVLPHDLHDFDFPRLFPFMHVFLCLVMFPWLTVFVHKEHFLFKFFIYFNLF